MQYIEAPNEFSGPGPAVFLAGGISDAENWQAQLVRKLGNIDATILNPRRRVYPRGDRDEDRRQIKWEYRHLLKADLVAFWFPPQTLCPIALFELGVCCGSQIPMIVGVDPNYLRRFDLEVQLELHRPDVLIVDRLETLAENIINSAALQGAPR
jgi:hypothetical protein